MKPETYSEAVKRIGRVGPFAPGDYVCSCVNCGIQFYGDKRAISCLPCAISVREEGRQATKEKTKALEDALREIIDVRVVKSADNIWSAIGRARDIARYALSQARGPQPCGEQPGAEVGATAALAWLAENQNCELSFDYGDADENGDGWRVHRVNGGVNDREWTLIGTGPTPEAAIVAAMGGAR